MFQLLGKIPNNFYLACSGGSDSMVFADFLLKYPKNQFELLYFNHGTPSCDEAEIFVKQFADKHNLKLHIGKLSEPLPTKGSLEDFWHKARYNFLSNFTDKPIIMCHHLNDCIESWIMSSLKGNPKLISYKNPKFNIIRPFLLISKTQIEDWATRHNVKYIIDKSNFDTKINRNYVRHVMMPNIRHLNPGIETSIRAKVLEQWHQLG